MAEVFGTELALGQDYTFLGTKAAVFTYYGCQLEYTGSDILNEYTSDETPMNIYANLHFALESLRSQGKPPNVLIVGPPDVGKTSLCKILCAYANKAGNRFPMFVNLDPSIGVYSAPGGLSAAPISDILDVEDATGGWGSSQINGPAVLHPKQPLVYYYGLETASTNTKYYKNVVSRLALGVTARLSKDKRTRDTGVIVDTPGVGVADDKEKGYNIISSIISDFNINVLVVVGDERLYSSLQKKYKEKESLNVLKVKSSGGCVDREPSYIRSLQSLSIKEYFYGSVKQPLDPYSVTVDYSQIVVYRVAEEKSLNITSVLPIGTEEQAESHNGEASTDSSYLIKLEPSAILQNCVMAMLNAEPNDPIETLIHSEVLGFVHV